MFTNRFVLIVAALSMLLVTLAVSRPFSKPTKTVELSQSSRPVILPVTGAEARPYIMDSATRSYIAWGQAMQVRNTIDSGTRSYIAWGKALEKAKLNALDSGTRSYIAWGEALKKAKLSALDSGTRSYIAWGEALQAAGKLTDSDACTNATQENIFAGIPNNVDSATRSYIAWGLALQAKNDIEALCR
jgi:hypothetical protein